MSHQSVNETFLETVSNNKDHTLHQLRNLTTLKEAPRTLIPISRRCYAIIEAATVLQECRDNATQFYVTCIYLSCLDFALQTWYK